MLGGPGQLAALDGLPAGRLELTLLGDARPQVDRLLERFGGGRPRPTLAVEVGDPERLDRERLAWLAGVADDVLVAAADVDRVAERARARAGGVRAGRPRPGRASGWRCGCRCRSAGRWPRPRPAGTPSRPSPPWARRPGPGCSAPWSTATSGFIALAHAGVTDLRCVLPGAPDIHDVIAQATAMTVGTVAKLRPGAPRSPAPPPPEGWGGRSRFPGRHPEVRLCVNAVWLRTQPPSGGSGLVATVHDQVRLA